MTRIARLAATLLLGVTPLAAWAQPSTPVNSALQTTTPRARSTPAPGPTLPAATDEQKELATRVHTGEIPCELGQVIRVRGVPTAVGYIEVAFARQTYVMKPVLSQTGAIRLEDVQGFALLLQLGNKSMLMNVKAGQRLADECVHPVQKAAAEAALRAVAEARARGEAPRGLFDAPATPTLTVSPGTSTLAGTSTTPALVVSPASVVATPTTSVTSDLTPSLNLSIPR